MSILAYLHKKLNCYGLLLMLVALMSACIFEDDHYIPNNNESATEAYLKIQLNLPEMALPTIKDAKTRSMSQQDERMIDSTLLNVLIFDSEGKFVYKAPKVGTVVYDDKESKKSGVITVKLVKSKNSTEAFSMVVVANCDLTDSELTSTSTLDNLKNTLKYTANTKWGVEGSEYKPFPMWGQLDNLVISQNMSTPTINLTRALARIDVGLNFEAGADNHFMESATGVDGFKLKEVYVYRTNKAGLVAPLDSGQVHVPSGVTRHSDESPLIYQIDNPSGSDSYVREIYVPETELPGTPNNMNMQCVVIGGYYKNSPNVTYYRLDFADTAESEADPSYLSILRNHRYVFNIKSVRGPGFTTANDALASEPTIGEIGFDLIVLDETIHEIKVSGKYYFGLDNRDLLFEPYSTVENPSKSFKIKYQTNYPLSENDTVALTWASGKNAHLFKATWIENQKVIKIDALTSNTSNEVLSDSLRVTVGPITISVLVQQQYVDFKYLVNCESVKVNGVYTIGTLLKADEHYIDLTLTAQDRSLHGKNYILQTESLEGDYGISFYAQGIFDFDHIPEGSPLTISVRMTASGVVTNTKQGVPFLLRINSNSSSGSYCEATIVPVGRKLRIVTLGRTLFGYNPAQPKTGSNKVLTAPTNFGPYNNSIVKIQGFEFMLGEEYWDGIILSNQIDQLKQLLLPADGKNGADILHIAFDFVIPSSTSTGKEGEITRCIEEFMDKNGVVVAFVQESSYKSAANLAKVCFKNSSITQVNAGEAGSVYKLSGDPTNPEDSLYLADPILNGPFGDVRGKHWGEDISTTQALANLPMDDLIVYSTAEIANIGSENNSVEKKNQITGFRHKTKNFVFFGDGGFMASLYDSNPAVELAGNRIPFFWDVNTMFPQPYPTYGYGTPKTPVYNSQVWCNVMAWAVDRALNHGINTGK